MDSTISKSEIFVAKGIAFEQIVEPNFLDTLKTHQLELPFNWQALKMSAPF